MKLVLNSADDATTVGVVVAPRASRTRIVGVHDGALKVALTSPPVDGEANAELVAFLAKRLGVAKGDVRIVRGATSKKKTLALTGVTPEHARAALEEELDDARSKGS